MRITNWCFALGVSIGVLIGGRASAAEDLLVGIAEVDITPPLGFPMAGYYHERLAEGVIDPLKAKAIVFRGKNQQAAWVVCDLIGISSDLAHKVRDLASKKTGIPVSNIVISGTHTHTAPDYTGELCHYLGKKKMDPLRAAYIDRLINGPADVIATAFSSAKKVQLSSGAVTQKKTVSFNRRFVMKDGSVKTWMRLDNPEVVRAAGPIDPEIGVMVIQDDDGEVEGVVSSFALHLDTVGGTKWSADFPFFIEHVLREQFGDHVVSLFGTGCCGDINHADPTRRERNKAELIGTELGSAIKARIGKLSRISQPELIVKSQVVQLPLQNATREEVAHSIKIVEAARRKEKVDFFEHVTAYKKLMLDQLLHANPFSEAEKHMTWGRSRIWSGVGESLPVEVTVMALGDDLAMVFLPGEVFVELGMAIKQCSPYRTTLIVELSNCVETIYIPNRAAYAGGSYEVTNSALQPGCGEMLVEAALTLLRKTREE